MKKSLVLTLGLFLAVVGVTSCGNKAADEARQKAIADSLLADSLAQVAAAAEQARLDSLAAVATADSLAKAQLLADSLEWVKTHKGKPWVRPVTETPTTETPKEETTGEKGKEEFKDTESPKDRLKGDESPKEKLKGTK